MLKEGIIVGIVWLIINLMVDSVVLVPIAKMGIGKYYAHIGLRYLLIPTLSFAIRYSI